MRLIDADALILEYRPLLTRAIEEGDSLLYTHCKSAVFALKSSPTISPDSLRPKGRWVRSILADDFHRCSECASVWNRIFNFCPNCGADMR